MTSTDDNDPFKEIFEEKNATKKSNPQSWLKRKSVLLHKKKDQEDADIEKGGRGPTYKERNLLNEDAEDDTDTGYVAPPTDRVKGPKPGAPEGDGPSKSSLLASVFRKFALILGAAGFFPYYLVEEEDGYYQVVIKKKSFRYIFLHIAFIINCIIYGIVCIGYIFVDNNWPTIFGDEPYLINASNAFAITESNVRWEHVMISNYWVMLIVVWVWMTMGIVGTFHTLYYSKDYGHFHSYWHKTLTMLDIDPTDYIQKFMMKEGITFVIMLILFFIFFVVAASFRICCGLIGCFLFGFFTRNAPEWSGFILVQLIGFLIVMYGYSGTRAALLQFVFYCRILTNTAKIWNYRFESVLVGAMFQDHLTPKMFAQYRIILKDHFLVVQLYKLTEGCFGGTLQIYYILQTVCLVLMSLYLYFTLAARKIQVSTYTNFSYQKFDWYFITYVNETPEVRDEGEYSVQSTQRALHTIFYIFLFFQGLMSSYHVTAWAQIALDEGMDGFNVLRKHGLVMCTNRSERNLIHSLTISFARNNPLAISADGYFTVDKQLFLMIIAMIVNYVTMLIQFNFEEYVVSSVDFRLWPGKPEGDKTLLSQLPE